MKFKREYYGGNGYAQYVAENGMYIRRTHRINIFTGKELEDQTWFLYDASDYCLESCMSSLKEAKELANSLSDNIAFNKMRNQIRDLANDSIIFTWTIYEIMKIVVESEHVMTAKETRVLTRYASEMCRMVAKNDIC